MADTASERIRVEAPADRCFDVASDFESYPEWARDVRAAKVLETDGEGRGTKVEFRAAALGKSIRYVLAYDFAEAPEAFSWKFVEGDMLRRLDGTYRFEAEDAEQHARALRPHRRARGADAGNHQAPRRRLDHGKRAQGAQEAGRSRRLTHGRGDNLPALMRILLFTGKGGVGKTTVAAGTAARIAASGRRTVVLSTDPAHSLADAFDLPLGDQPTGIAPNLWGQQLNARVRFEEAWDDVREYMVGVLDWAGADAVEAEELAVVPGLDEVFALADIKEFATSGDYDTVVVDCAPTAETIRLLSLPEILVLVHGPSVRDAAPGHSARTTRPRQAHVAADRGRSGVRRDPQLLRAPRRRP